MTSPTPKSPTITLGIVDDYAGERVETEFRTLFGVLPLAPVGSYYRRSEDQRYPIALHTKSVLKATLSNHALYLTIAIFALAAFNLHDPLGELLLLTGVMSALVSAFARFRLGRPTKSEERQRALHLEVTGVSALPDMLPSELLTTLRDALERKWRKRGGKASWRDLLDAGRAEADDLKLLAVLTALDAGIAEEPGAKARAATAWSALEAEGYLPLESLSPEEAAQVLNTASEEPTPAAPELKVPQLKVRTRAARSTRKRKRHSTSRGIKIRCERCEHVTRVPHSCAGQTGRCPSCARGVRVPSRESLRLLRAA